MAWNIPADFTAAQDVDETDLNQILDCLHEIGDAWTSWTPQLWQGSGTANIAKTVNYAKYRERGKLVTVAFDLSITGSGTSGQQIRILNLPVAAASAAALSVGSFLYYTGTCYMLMSYGVDTASLSFDAHGQGSGGFGAASAFAVANGHSFKGEITYEAA